jgi:hypothetical protein
MSFEKNIILLQHDEVLYLNGIKSILKKFFDRILFLNEILIE